MVHYLVLVHLENVLGYLQAERHMQELIPATMSIENCQVWWTLIEVNAPEDILCIQLTEAGSTAKSMGDLIEGKGLIMLSHYGLLQVLWVKAYTQGTIRLVRVHEEQYPLSWARHRSYNTLGDHVVEGLLNLLSVLDGDLPLGLLDWGYGRVGPDGIGPRYVANGVELVREGSLEGNYVPGGHCGESGCLSQGGLRVLSADFGTGWDLEGFRDNFVVEGKVGIWGVTLVVCYLNITFFAVFLKLLLQGDEEGVWCGWGLRVGVKGSLNVTFWAVFHNPPGEGRETVSMFTWIARLETLNSGIPKHSDMV